MPILTGNCIEQFGTSVIVIRGPGDFEGPPIIDPLLTSDVPAVERGRNELNDYAHASRDVEVSIKATSGFRKGQVVKIVDAAQGQVYGAKIVGISHNCVNSLDPTANTGDFYTETRLSLRRPTVFYS